MNEKHHINRRLLLVTCILASLLGLTACGQKSSEDGITNVRIAYFPNITHSQALIIKHQQGLEALWGENCKVSWTSFNAGPAEVEALFAGEIDIGYIGPVPALNANVKSEGDVKIISNCTNAGAVLLSRTDSGIQEVTDLNGKKVAVPQLGNTQHLCLLNLMKEYQLENIEINASSNADILNLMDNKVVDAALVPEPWGSIIEQNGSAELLLNDKEVFLGGEYPTTVVIVRKDFMEAHPELVEDFLKVHEEATVYIRQNQKKAQAIVNEEICSVTGKELSEEILESSFSRMEASSSLNRDAIMQFAKISMEEGFISRMPEEQDVFTDEFDH